jgi:hypothetical protein
MLILSVKPREEIYFDCLPALRVVSCTHRGVWITTRDDDGHLSDRDTGPYFIPAHASLVVDDVEVGVTKCNNTRAKLSFNNPDVLVERASVVMRRRAELTD